jgi:hypothetical protein
LAGDTPLAQEQQPRRIYIGKHLCPLDFNNIPMFVTAASAILKKLDLMMLIMRNM